MYMEIRNSIVLTLYGNSETGGHLCSNLCYLIICLIRSRAVTNQNFFPEKTYFHAFTKCSELPSEYHGEIVKVKSEK